MPGDDINDPHALLVAAGEECRACGAAHGAVGVKVGKPDTLPGHLVDARRLDPAIVKAHIATTQIIGQDDNHIGPGPGRRPRDS